MEINITVPNYNEMEGIIYNWEEGFEIVVEDSGNEIIIKANKAGLISLAVQLLTLAQEMVPINNHLHYDEYNSLEKDSKELIIQKTA